MAHLNFEYHKESITQAIVEHLPVFPTKKEALSIFKSLQNNLSNLSLLKQFKPRYAVIYYSVRGYKASYKMVLSEVDMDFNRPFPDEPRGKFTGKRKTFKISDKELIN